jgi:coronin-2
MHKDMYTTLLSGYLLAVLHCMCLSIAQEGVCHAGTKACKVVFLGNTGRVLTTGFSRHSDRQYAVWSQSDLSAPLCIETIDCSSGVLFPYYDHDTRIVFLAGKVSSVW